MVSLRGFVLDKPSGFRGQGSLEYLLVIGVVILITAIVIGAVSGVLTFGKIGASQDQADSVYTGLLDVMDLAKGRTTLSIKLKQGENILEFDNIVEKTIWTMFGNLPENTQIIIDNAKCENGNTYTDTPIDANKKADGSGFAYLQNNGEKNVNSCIVPSNTQVKIYSPENTEVNIPTEKDGDVWQEISDVNALGTAIKLNEAGSFKLIKVNGGWYTYDCYPLYNSLPAFSGKLDGMNNCLTIHDGAEYDKNYYFEALNGAEIKNLDVKVITSVKNFTLANTCGNAQKNNPSLTNTVKCNDYACTTSVVTFNVCPS